MDLVHRAEQLSQVPERGVSERGRSQNDADAVVTGTGSQHADQCGEQLERRAESIAPTEDQMGFVNEDPIQAGFRCGLLQALSQAADSELG